MRRSCGARKKHLLASCVARAKGTGPARDKQGKGGYKSSYSLYVKNREFILLITHLPRTHPCEHRKTPVRHPHGHIKSASLSYVQRTNPCDTHARPVRQAAAYTQGNGTDSVGAARGTQDFRKLRERCRRWWGQKNYIARTVAAQKIAADARTPRSCGGL